MNDFHREHSPQSAIRTSIAEIALFVAYFATPVLTPQPAIDDSAADLTTILSRRYREESDPAPSALLTSYRKTRMPRPLQVLKKRLAIIQTATTQKVGISSERLTGGDPKRNNSGAILTTGSSGSRVLTSRTGVHSSIPEDCSEVGSTTTGALSLALPAPSRLEQTYWQPTDPSQGPFAAHYVCRAGVGVLAR